MKKSEEIEAEKFAKWLILSGYAFSHIPNESGLPAKVAMLAAIKKKRMWVSPWFPDYSIILKRWSLLFIELKKNRTKKKNWEYYALSTDWIDISDEQKKWIERLEWIDNVWACFCFWFEDAQKTVMIQEKQ